MTVQAARLEDRGFIAVEGDDARPFLHNLVTSDIEGLSDGHARHAALLTPQGKILFDFIVLAAGGALYLDVAAPMAADLAKRLSFYKLRAKVTIRDVSGEFAVVALFGGPAVTLGGVAQAADPRLDALGARALLPQADRDKLIALSGAHRADETAYHAHRIALGVPEGGKDFVHGDTFPHEADMDQLGGVDFRKGCYVGQEVVARMQHKTVVRKRVVPVKLQGDAAIGADVVAGGIAIGRMGSSAGGRGLALLRLDRVADALEAGTPLLCGEAVLSVLRPDWARFDVPGFQPAGA